MAETLRRKKTRQIRVRDVLIGGANPVVIQSMANTPTEDIERTLGQIEALHRAGSKIVRVAVANRRAIDSFREIRAQTEVPLVADIHFQHGFAIAAIEAGADKVRINPGNIGSEENVRKVIDAAKSAGVPLRIGVNAGSLEEDLIKKYIHPVPQALAESAMRYVAMMERMKFENFILSIKASDVLTTVNACRLLAAQTDYPQHIGITESGTPRTGSIRSAVGLGILLSEGIGDTIRVSLAGDPLEEIPAAKEILKSLGLASGPVVIACPTCGRTQIDVAALALKVEQMVAGIDKPIKIAVMGCIVNGPGEARDADVGIAGGVHEGRIFVRGQTVATVPEERLLEELWKQIRNFVGE